VVQIYLERCQLKEKGWWGDGVMGWWSDGAMGRMFNQPLPITSPPYLPTLYSKQEHYFPDALGVHSTDMAGLPSKWFSYLA
jgi:hypothetical protein